MAEFFPPVIFEIKAKATEAIATFGEVNKELDKMEAKGKLAGGSLGGLQKASKLAGTALLGLGGTFAVFAAASVKETLKVEDSQVMLQNAIKNTGVSFTYIQPLVDQSAASMRNLGFSTEDTYTALTAMTRASGSPALALKSLGVAADLARAKNISLAQAGTIVARASVGQARGLADLGIAIGKTIPKGASLEQIFAAIEKRVGGSANAFKNTLSGGIEVAQAQFKNLETQLGERLIPTLNKVLNWFIKTGIPALKSFGSWIANNKGLVESIGVTIASLWAVGKIATFLTYLGKVTGAFTAIETAATAAAVAEGAAEGGAVASVAGVAAAGVEAPSLVAAAAAALPAVPLLALAYKRKKDADKMTKDLISTTNLEHYVAGKKPGDPGYNAQYESTIKAESQPTFMRAAPKSTPWWDVYRKAENWIHNSNAPMTTPSPVAPSTPAVPSLNDPNIQGHRYKTIPTKTKTTKVKAPKGANAKVGLMSSSNQHLTVEFKANNSAVITGITHSTSKAK